MATKADKRTEEVIAELRELRKSYLGDPLGCVCDPRECSWDKAGAFEPRKVDPNCPHHGDGRGCEVRGKDSDGTTVIAGIREHQPQPKRFTAGEAQADPGAVLREAMSHGISIVLGEDGRPKITVTVLQEDVIEQVEWLESLRREV